MDVFYFLCIILIVYILYKILVKSKAGDSGYVVIKDLINKGDVEKLLVDWDNKNYQNVKGFFKNNKDIGKKINSILGDDYTMIDYTYMIENSAIHTFHRDYTSCQNYNNLEYPSYTMILYLDDSDTGLQVIPQSHNDNQWIYFTDKSKKLYFKSGTAILFNANLLHSGSIVSGKVKRHCIQFKVIHKDDIQKMPWLQDFHVLINKPNNKSENLKYLEMKATMHFPIFMDMFQSMIKTSFHEEKTYLQKIISNMIFSDAEFYKPIRI